ncbi:unnamed protein product, partial [Didymodactylos carnosus]
VNNNQVLRRSQQSKIQRESWKSKDERYFVKIHAPFEILLVLAEKTRVKLPFSINKSPLKQGLFEKGLPCAASNLDRKEFPEEPSYFTAVYQKNLHYRFSEYFGDVNTVFRPAERSRLVYELLRRCPYRLPDMVGTGMEEPTIPALSDNFRQLIGNHSKQNYPYSQMYEDYRDKEPNTATQMQTLKIEEVFTSSTRRSGIKGNGIEILLQEGVYEAAYPLHDKLYYRWARFRNLFRVQPIQLIRDYFGEKIAFYFCWLGWYNTMLILPSILGIFVLLYGIIVVRYDQPTIDICNSNSTKYLMCPRVDRKMYWLLNETCFTAKISYIFDNPCSIGFALFVSVWALLLPFLWHRNEYKYQFVWDMTDVPDESEILRPDFERRVTKTILNPITEKHEPYVPRYKRLLYYLSSFSVVLFMVVLVFAVVFGVIIYRLSVTAALASIDSGVWIYKWKSPIVLATAAAINLIIIICLQYFYEILAIWLTNFELHRTDKTYEDSLTIKMFLFQFVNYYASIFYIALIKPLIVRTPLHLNLSSQALRFEECDVSGCIWELSFQLIIIMVGKQLLSNIWEMCIAKFWNLCRKKILFRDTVKEIEKREKRLKLTEHDCTMKNSHDTQQISLKRMYEEDFLLQGWDLATLFYEYLELVLQFGFVTMFIVSFPLAPLFALINNLFEIRVDALKVIKELRRPVASRSMSIGTWNNIISVMAKIAVLSN